MTTPWEYLKNWSMSDRNDEERTLTWLNNYMQKRWPGPYRVNKTSAHGYIYHVIVFDTPADETFYKMKWL